jgi:hypothetical protein
VCVREREREREIIPGARFLAVQVELLQYGTYIEEKGYHK